MTAIGSGNEGYEAKTCGCARVMGGITLATFWSLTVEPNGDRSELVRIEPNLE